MPRGTAVIVGDAERFGFFYYAAGVKGDPVALVFWSRCGADLPFLTGSSRPAPAIASVQRRNGCKAGIVGSIGTGRTPSMVFFG